MNTRRPQQDSTDSPVPAADLIDWRVTKVQVSPYPGFWAFNPSAHFDGEIWRMSVRCADYGMPGGVQIRGPNADRLGVQSRNAMVHLDPHTWRPTEIFPMLELDGFARNRCGNRGYEDIRIFRTDAGGLQGIAASAHLERDNNSGQYMPEQIILTLDELGEHAGRYSIIGAQPIRGDAWNGPQKNWSPFDNAEEPRFLYSIDRGIVFSSEGPINDVLEAPAPKPVGPPPSRVLAPLPVNGTEFRRVQRVRAIDPTPLGRKKFDGLRGGTQLVHLGDGSWLGLGHEMRLERGRKLYWHRFYLIDADGKLQAMSPAMKIAREGIEFAAGLVVDDDHVVVSFGVDDAECRMGETSLDEVRRILTPMTGDAMTTLPPRHAMLGTRSQARPLARTPVALPVSDHVMAPLTRAHGVKRFDALDDDQLAMCLDVDALRAAYVQLRTHHLQETTSLLHELTTVYRNQATNQDQP